MKGGCKSSIIKKKEITNTAWDSNIIPSPLIGYYRRRLELGFNSVVDHLSCICKILSSISRTTKQGKKIEGSNFLNSQKIAYLLSTIEQVLTSISVKKQVSLIERIYFYQRNVSVFINTCFYYKYKNGNIKIEKKVALYIFQLSYNYMVEWRFYASI